MKTISNLINSTIRHTHDSIDKEMYEIESWVNEILLKTMNSKKDYCEICEYVDLQNLELHHIAGRKHDFRCITVCKPCHDWLSKRQRVWDKRWLLHNSSKVLKIAFFCQGLQDILYLKSKKTENTIYQKIADGLIEKISALLEQDWEQNHALC